MKRVFIAILIIGAMSVSLFARPVKRIVFKKGATKVVVTGYLNGFKDKQVYLLKVRAGQVIHVETDGPTVSMVSPTGEEFFMGDLSCHSTVESTSAYSQSENGSNSTVAGDYKITVTECQKADPFKGKFKLTVTVK